jgi:hypothetical protein
MSLTAPKDGFNSGFDNFIGSAFDTVGGLLNVASEYEGLRQQRDRKGEGQDDLTSAVVTDYNPQPTNGTKPAGEGNFANINNQTLMIVGTAVGGLALIIYLIRK